jgi:hypothetical protein
MCCAVLQWKAFMSCLSVITERQYLTPDWCSWDGKMRPGIRLLVTITHISQLDSNMFSFNDTLITSIFLWWHLKLRNIALLSECYEHELLPPFSVAVISNSSLVYSVPQHFQDNAWDCAGHFFPCILENHESYTSFAAANFCKNSHIHQLSFQPYSRHRVHSLNRSFFGLFGLSVVMNVLSGCLITQVFHLQFIKAFCFRKGLCNTTTSGNALKEFEVSGKCVLLFPLPWNRCSFPKELLFV